VGYQKQRHLALEQDTKLLDTAAAAIVGLYVSIVSRLRLVELMSLIQNEIRLVFDIDIPPIPPTGMLFQMRCKTDNKVHSHYASYFSYNSC